MPIYLYKGYIATDGSNKKGKCEAESIKAAKSKLRKSEKIIVTDIREEVAVESKSKSSIFDPKVKKADLAVMSRQFATLQNAHIPLDDTLIALTDQVDNLRLKNTLANIKDQVSEGKSLGDSMSKFPNIFDKLFVNMVKAGESSGTLGVVMSRLANYVEKTVETQGQIMSAMAYPAVMILAISGIVVFMLLTLVPKLQKIFISFNIALPWYTQLVVSLSHILKTKWFLFPIIGVAIYFMFKSWFGSAKGRRTFDRLILKTPIFGGLVLRIQTSRFTETLSTLLNAGVPIIKALEITRNTITNSIIADVVNDSMIAVQEGKELGATIKKSGRFPSLVVHMIMTGEKTGKLEEMLAHVALAYDSEVKRKIDAIISLIEPAMVIFMVLTVGSILGAIMIPMLSIMNNVR